MRGGLLSRWVTLEHQIRERLLLRCKLKSLLIIVPYSLRLSRRTYRRSCQHVLFRQCPSAAKVFNTIIMIYIKVKTVNKNSFFSLTLFRSGGYQIDTCLPFSLYLRHGFRSESEQTYQNRVDRVYLERLIRC